MTNNFEACGHIVNFNTILDHNSTIEDLNRLIDKAHEAKNITCLDYLRTVELIECQGMNYRIAIVSLFVLFSRPIFPIEYRRLVNESRDLIKSYKNAFLNIFDLDTEVERFTGKIEKEIAHIVMNDILEKIQSSIEIMLFSERISKITKDFVLCVQNLKPYYFDKLPLNCQGVIAKECKEPLRNLFASEYAIPIIKTGKEFKDDTYVAISHHDNEIIVDPSNDEIISVVQAKESMIYKIGDKPSYNDSPIKLFAPISNTRYLDIIAFDEWYHGCGPIKSEFLFMTKNYIPSQKDQIEYYVNIFSKMIGKEIIVSIPNFGPFKENSLTKDAFTDLITLNKYERLYTINMEAIAEASVIVGTPVKVIVPMIRLNNEVKYWKELIQDAFEIVGAEKPEVGIFIETESTYEFYEDYKGMDFAIIGLNDLIEEISDDYDRYSELSKEEFLEVFWPDIRDLHQHLRSYRLQVRHMVSGNLLKNPQIFNKFLVAGFKEFCMPIHLVKCCEDSITKYTNTRGSFVGVAAQRIEDKKTLKQRQEQRERKKLMKKVERFKEKKRKAKERKENAIKNKAEKNTKLSDENDE